MITFLALIGLPFAFAISRLAIKRGYNQWFALLGFVPVVNIAVVIWLALQPAKTPLARPPRVEPP